MGDEKAGLGETGGSFDWNGAEDLTALSEEELRAHLAALSDEERALGYRREVLRGRIDVLRAELVRRGAYGSLEPEELARVLLGETGRGS